MALESPVAWRIHCEKNRGNGWFHIIKDHGIDELWRSEFFGLTTDNDVIDIDIDIGIDIGIDIDIDIGIDIGIDITYRYRYPLW